MIKKNKFLIIILLFTFSIDADAQETYKKISLFMYNGIEFCIEQSNLEFNIKDSFDIKYKVSNNKDYGIYIFDPASYHEKISNLSFDSNSCFNKIELGGNWLFNIGYQNILILRKIESKSNYEFNFRCVINRSGINDNCGKWINHTLIYLSNNLLFSLFINIGFIKEKDINDLIKMNKIDENVIEYEVKSLDFEDKINRIILGPIWLIL